MRTALSTVDVDPEAGERRFDEPAPPTAEEVGRWVITTLEEQVRRRPWWVLAAGFGVGYVVGGGIPRFVERLVVRAGLRYVVTNLSRFR